MDPAHAKLFEREPFFKAGGAPRSVIVSPIFVQGRLSGAIYLAARAGVPAVSTSHVGLLCKSSKHVTRAASSWTLLRPTSLSFQLPLATFAAIILASHHAYATLEAAVETRTNQLEQALAHRQTFISAISHEASSETLSECRMVF
jgi:GAF domain-containing protein